MKCAIFEEHSSSCVVYFRFSDTLFPVSMIDGDTARPSFEYYRQVYYVLSGLQNESLQVTISKLP